MRLKPYSRYKDSNLEWLTAVPSHWEINKIGRISEFGVGWTPPTGIQENFEGDNKWANISDLGPRTIYDTAKRISDDAVETSRLKVSPRGSLLFGFKLSVGDVSFAGTDMYTNEAIATFFESKRVTLRYAYYAYPLFIIENAGENIYGARILNQERIRNAKIALPSIKDQLVIAEFLDRETAEIDAFIADQERLIELLEERRAATITHAVTKGLDPNSPMKNSGIEWLGSVPEGWAIAPLKWVSQLVTGTTPSTTVEGHFTDDVDGFPWIRPEDIDESGQPTVASKTLSSTGRHLVRVLPPKTVLLVCIGATLGKVGITADETSTNQQITSIYSKSIESKYLFFTMQAAYPEIRLAATGTTLPILNSSRLGSLRLPLPSEKEQQLISTYLERETTEIDAAVGDAREAIALSRERRAALISAAVTGQLDVSQHDRPVEARVDEVWV